MIDGGKRFFLNRHFYFFILSLFSPWYYPFKKTGVHFGKTGRIHLYSLLNQVMGKGSSLLLTNVAEIENQVYTLHRMFDGG